MTNRKLINWFLPIAIFTLFWGVVLIYTGTLTSGFHFIDDHEIIRIGDDLSRSNVLQVSVDWITRDFGLRFRPIYYLHRVFSVELLGTNFLLLSLQNLGLAVLTSWFLFLFVRNLKFSSIYSYIFVFTGLVGTQAAIWWRLGPNETIGVFLFSVGLYALSKSYIIKTRRRPYKYLALTSFILASLCKESFIMMIPLTLFLNFYLFHIRSELNKSLTWRQNIRVNKWFNAILSLVFLIEGYFVMFVVGANKIGYAGGDASSLSPSKILTTFRSLVLESNWQLLLVAIALYFVGLGTYYYRNKKWPLNRLQLLTVALLGFLIAVGPQLVLYAKSGIYERYLIPGTLGFSFLFIFLLRDGISFFTDRRIKNIIWAIFLVLGLIFFYPKFKTMLVFGQAFAADGRAINAALMDIETSSTEHDAIIIVAEPSQNFEESYSLKNYLVIEQKKSNLYFEVVNLSDTEADFEKGPKRGFINFLEAQDVTDLPDTSVAQVVFVFGNVEEKFLRTTTWFDVGAYHRDGYGKYVVYSKLP